MEPETFGESATQRTVRSFFAGGPLTVCSVVPVQDMLQPCRNQDDDDDDTPADDSSDDSDDYEDPYDYKDPDGDGDDDDERHIVCMILSQGGWGDFWMRGSRKFCQGDLWMGSLRMRSLRILQSLKLFRAPLRFVPAETMAVMTVRLTSTDPLR
jgi:hypothetical protein